MGIEDIVAAIKVNIFTRTQPLFYLNIVVSPINHHHRHCWSGLQDANECWTQIVRMLQQKLPSMKSTEMEEQAEGTAGVAAASATAAKGFIDQYFGE